MSALAAPVPLSQDEINAAYMDPVLFTDRHCWIQGKGGTPIPFRVTGEWDFQRQVLEAMDDEDRLLVLKARQLGISWTADAFALWLCTFNHGQTVLIISKGLRESQEEMERIKFMHRRLPDELRRLVGSELPPDERGKLTTQVMEFPEMGSRIVCLPSTENTGTSFTAQLVIVHELSKIPTARALMTALMPTIADSGRLFVVSTAKGYGNVFHGYWKAAEARWHTGQVVGDAGEPGEWRPVFISWRARPGRDDAWYAATERSLEDGDMTQEYPETPTEAFQGSSDAVFAKEFDRHGPFVVKGTPEEDSPHEQVVFVDPGVNNAYAYLVQLEGRMAWAYYEIHIQDGTVYELGAAIRDAIVFYGFDPEQVMVYPDPFGMGHNLHTNKTDADVLAECGLLVQREPKKHLPGQRVGHMKMMFRQQRWWVTGDLCPNLITALEQAQWKKHRAPNGDMVNEDTYEKDGVHEHPLDATGNGLCQVFPPLMAAAADVEAVAAVGAGAAGGYDYGYSGSEFGG